MKRTIQLILADDKDLRQTLEVFRQVQQQVSKICFKCGRPLTAIELHKLAYDKVKGRLRAQMTCSAIRMVASTYSRKRRYGSITKELQFNKRQALFLIGEQRRDAGFLKTGDLTIWTTNGRKKIRYSMPNYFKSMFEESIGYDTLLVSDDGDRLKATLAVTLFDPPTITDGLPIGLFVNRRHDLVVVDSAGRSMRTSGTVHRIATSIASKRHKRLQIKLLDRVSSGMDTRSIRRQLIRLERKSRCRTILYCREAAKYLEGWLPEKAVLVFQDGEDVQDPIINFLRKTMRQSIESRMQTRGIPSETVTVVDAETRCSNCGSSGRSDRTTFKCQTCGLEDVIDRNTANNIRIKFTALRSSGLLPASPEAPQ